MSSFSTTSLLLFCALLGSAFTLTCKSCVSGTSATCEESDIECPGTKCMTASQFFHNGDVMVQSFYKGCAVEALCGQFGSVTKDPEVKIRVNAVCCDGDGCNTDAFYLPEENTTLNGFSCPKSYCVNTENCKTKGKQQCTGSETKCIDYRGTVQNPDETKGDYSVKGCINPTGCFYKFDILIKTKEISRVRLVC